MGLWSAKCQKRKSAYVTRSSARASRGPGAPGEEFACLIPKGKLGEPKSSPGTDKPLKYRAIDMAYRKTGFY